MCAFLNAAAELPILERGCAALFFFIFGRKKPKYYPIFNIQKNSCFFQNLSIQKEVCLNHFSMVIVENNTRELRAPGVALSQVR